MNNNEENRNLSKLGFKDLISEMSKENKKKVIFSEVKEKPYFNEIDEIKEKSYKIEKEAVVFGLILLFSLALAVNVILHFYFDKYLNDWFLISIMHMFFTLLSAQIALGIASRCREFLFNNEKNYNLYNSFEFIFEKNKMNLDENNFKILINDMYEIIKNDELKKLYSKKNIDFDQIKKIKEEFENKTYEVSLLKLNSIKENFLMI